MPPLNSYTQNDSGQYAGILLEIRDRYKYARDAWASILKEAQEDMRYVCGDPWSARDKAERNDAGRPYLVMDELGQYLNQTKNQLRQNPRGIKIDPVGEGANDKTADFYQSLIRGIEYDSNATRNAYQPAFESALERGYGFYRVTRKYVHGKKHQVIHLKGILNPDSVVYDPDYTEADWSDARYCFIVEPMSKELFKLRFPKATIQDFSSEDQLAAPDWIQDQMVLVAEYWRVIEDEDGKRSVEQYMTNGVEILEPPTEELGSYLPIIPVIGREKYLTSGGRTERKIFSMVRLARDPYMYFCYLASQEAEEASLTPKVPIFAYVGQCETDAEAIQSMTKVPHAVIQFDPIVDQSNNQVLPIPTRPQFQPNFQAYEAAKDSASRSIMKAMGLSPLPTAAQRSNEKSGIALETIETQQNIGSFDFTDNFDRSLQLTGRILLEWIPQVYTEERHVGLVAADGKRRVVRINTAQPYDSGNGQMEHYQVIDEEGNPVGDHGVTISTGPSYNSQREAIASFLDQLIKALPTLPIPPPAATKLLALAVRARDLGPRGDQMAEIIEGDQNGALAQGQQAQAQLQKTQQLVQALQVELQKLQQEKAGKIIEHKGKMDQITLQSSADMFLEKMKLENQLAIAEVETKAQNVNERITAVEDMMKQFHEQAHDLGMQANEQAHEAAQAQAAQAAAAQTQQTAAAQEEPAEEPAENSPLNESGAQ